MEIVRASVIPSVNFAIGFAPIKVRVIIFVTYLSGYGTVFNSDAGTKLPARSVSDSHLAWCN